MRHRFGLTLVVVTLLLVPAPLPAAAQSPAQTQQPVRVQEAPASQPFDVQAATDAYLAQLSPEARARSDAYFEGGYWLQLWGFLYGLGVVGLLLFLGWSADMRDLAERLTGRAWLQSAIYAALFVLVTAVLDFPLTVYQGYIREHQYGLANQTFGPWLREQFIGLGLSLVIMPLVLMALYSVFRRAPRTWWLWGSAVAMVFLVLGMLIAPVYIAPLFNTYTPVEDPQIKDPILAMARANGVPVDNVYVFDASRQSTRISANVSGIFGTMRVSLNDNLLNRTSPEEIQAVLGHELGHYVLNHVYEGLVFFTLVILGGFAFMRWSFERARRRWGARWRVRGIADPAGLPLLIALFSIYGFVLTPVFNSFSRADEAEADIFGINASRQPDGFAAVAVKLSEYRKLDPGPLEEMVFYDHPSGRARIHMAMQWKAEHLGDSVPAPSPRAAGTAQEIDMEQLHDLGERYTAAWNSGEPANVAAFFAEDGSLTVNDGEPAVGRDAIAGVAKGFMDAFPDLELLMDDVEPVGNRVRYHWTFLGTNTGPGGTGNRVRFSGYEEWTLAGPDGPILRSLGYFDEAEYERQRAEGIDGA